MKVKYHQWTRVNTSELIMGLLLPAISMETMISQYLLPRCVHVFFSLVFSVVSQGHIRMMGRKKKIKKKTSVKLVHFVMIYSTGEAFRSKGIHPHNVLSFCGWSLPWTCINVWPPVMDHILQVTNEKMHTFPCTWAYILTQHTYALTKCICVLSSMSQYLSYLTTCKNCTLFGLHTV